MLAGRKLLLADDSVTIQKVIELTFADEGVRVLTFSNGQDAIDHLEEIAPDIVLADVFMPSKSGYEVCEYVKQNEKLKHVPVMLLVGSFEPFDEAEARRVGADDILTKPFQSIRRLIDRVGSLVNNPPAVKKEMPTAELPKNGHSTPENIKLNTEQLEVVTADTQQFPQELQETIEFPQPVMDPEKEFGDTIDMTSADVKEQTVVDSSDVLLDLGEYEPAHTATADDFILDLDVAPELEDTLGGAVSNSTPMRAFVEPQVTETVPTAAATGFAYEPEGQAPVYSNVEEVAYESEAPISVEPEPFPPVAQTGPLTPPPATAPVESSSVSNQMIDAIARRVVEMMSEKVVREIAWEVVPDLAELLIKKQLEETK